MRNTLVLDRMGWYIYTQSHGCEASMQLEPRALHSSCTHSACHQTHVKDVVAGCTALRIHAYINMCCKQRGIMFSQVPVSGLRTVAGGIALSEVAADIVRIARGGLRRRGLGEGIFLQPLDEIIAAGESNGQVTARRFREDWGGRVEPLLQAQEL